MSLLIKFRKKILSYFTIITMISLLNLSSVHAANFCEGYADLVKPLIPAVVNISILSKNSSIDPNQILYLPEGPQLEEFNKIFEHFDISPEEDGDKDDPLKPIPSGSGFIISAEGYIVTNYHVVDQAEKIIVILSNDQKLEAALVGFDRRTDLALLKISSKDPLPFVKFSDSDANRVGDIIIAIGNPFGLGSTVTSGIISAQARDINTSSLNIIDNFIQTDAAINRGNSGGPMFNTKGEVIGINFAIVSPTGNNIGISFAVPSSTAQPIIEQLIKTGKVQHGWLGVSTRSTDNIAESLKLSDGVGVLVSSVENASPAEKAGIKVGDLILKFDGKNINNNKKLPRIVAETPIDKKVNVEIISKGKRKIVTLIVGEIDTKSDTPEISVIDPNAVKSAYGMNLSTLTPELRKEVDIPSNINGILVSSLDPKSLARNHGIKQGDLINSINQKLVTKPSDLLSIMEEAKNNNGESIMLLIYRTSGNVFLSLPILDK